MLFGSGTGLRATEPDRISWPTLLPVTSAGPAPARPVLRRLARTFLNQDKVVVVRQVQGLPDAGRLMLIDDADTQAKWFARCKREYLRAQAESRPFRNPVEPRTLRWHS